ncbi:MAG: YifB family Mg chelatase-like AAA ATPase, partial [Clostridia bacterium]
MIAIVKSYSLEGIEGYPVDIEVDTQSGIPAFDVVGLPGSSVKEAKNRVRAAVKNSNYEFMPKRITVNLAPADIKKDGSQYDFPIAIGFLAVTEQLPPIDFSKYIMIGELSLDGGIRKVNGVLPILISAYQAGYRKFIIPHENASEAAYIDGAEVYPVKTLSDAAAFLGGILKIAPVPYAGYSSKLAINRYGTDISEVRGQVVVKRALEIAVAGGHNMLMCGAPGAGKTMLAKCVPSIMPDMTFAEAIETTKIHSVAGILDDSGIVAVRPFRTPHHTASLHSLTGGGKNSTPGEISLAHNGVLFLDEMPEYSKRTLETLRQPLEDGVITVTRVARSVEYPARFMLIASMNPCPCGYEGSEIKDCTCSTLEKRRYRARISGPLLDRIDIYADVDGIEYSEFAAKADAETSLEVKARVEGARRIQLARFGCDGIFVNARMTNAQIKKYCKLDKEGEMLLAAAYKRFG